MSKLRAPELAWKCRPCEFILCDVMTWRRVMTERAYTGVQYMHELSASALADPACPDSAAHSLIMVDCEVERRY